MSLYEDAVSAAVKLPLSQREALAQALGLKLAPRALLPMAPPQRPDAKSWREAERGHAVLDVPGGAGHIEPGPAAIRGLWADMSLDVNQLIEAPANSDTSAQIPAGSPVVVHTSVVTALALDLVPTRQFWDDPRVEVRLATATYLYLLEGCSSEEQRARVKAFVQPFAVLSLGPMASTRAAQLMLESGDSGLSALDSLVAATAIAHEIPLLTRTPGPFAGIDGLMVATLP